MYLQSEYHVEVRSFVHLVTPNEFIPIFYLERSQPAMHRSEHVGNGGEDKVLPPIRTPFDSPPAYVLRLNSSFRVLIRVPSNYLDLVST